MPMLPASSLRLRLVDLAEPGVHLGVHPAHEERRDRCHSVDRLASGEAGLQRRQVCLGHLQVVLDREQQGDVDVDAGGQALLDRRPALRGSGDLDHDIGPAYRPPKPVGLRDAAARVPRESRGHLDGDESVAAVGAVVHRAKEIGGAPHVLDREHLEDLGVAAARGGQARERLVVVVVSGDALLEDGGVRRHAPKAGVDEPGQLAGADHAAAQVVEPDALSQLEQIRHPGAGVGGCRHRLSSIHLPRSRSTRATTASGVRPSSR